MTRKGEVEVLCDDSKLGTLSSNPSGQLDILGHDCHALGMDGTQVGVLK